jgi:type III pantothenate kinase
MKVDIVADVGNSRIKWGKCTDEGVTEIVSLSYGESEWNWKVLDWSQSRPLCWAISGSQPTHRDRLAKWIGFRDDQVIVFDNYAQLPIEVLVDNPGQVGMDRLLNAVAGKWEGGRSDCTIIVDAGTAVTVDWIDDKGAFRGGAIFPGVRLMSQALHTHTALLPLVDVNAPNPPVPGTNTKAAIHAGVFWAVAGGIKALVRQMKGWADSPRHAKVFLTGGDAPLLLPVMDQDISFWPQMTLEGIRLAAEALP